MKRALLFFSCILGMATVCSAQSTLYFPQIVEGQSGGTTWGSGMLIMNTAAVGSAAASGTLTLTKDDGTPWVQVLASIDGTLIGPASSFPFQLSGGQTKLFLTQAMFDGQSDTTPLSAGFAPRSEEHTS